MSHTSQVFGVKARLWIWAFCWLFGGSYRVPLDRRWVGFPPLGHAEVDWDRNRVVGGVNGPRVSHTSHVFGDKENLC